MIYNEDSANTVKLTTGTIIARMGMFVIPTLSAALLTNRKWTTKPETFLGCMYLVIIICAQVYSFLVTYESNISKDLKGIRIGTMLLTHSLGRSIIKSLQNAWKPGEFASCWK